MTQLPLTCAVAQPLSDISASAGSVLSSLGLTFCGLSIDLFKLIQVLSFLLAPHPIAERCDEPSAKSEGNEVDHFSPTGVVVMKRSTVITIPMPVVIHPAV